jgi:ABC-2 type transport system permease protein
MKPYLAHIKGVYMSQIVYRSGFIFTALGNLLYIALVYFLWSSIYGTSSVIHGLTFSQTFVYLAFASSMFILFKTYSDWILSRRILDGSIIVDLFRPIDFQLQLLSRAAGFALANFTIVTLPSLAVVMLVVGSALPIGIGWLFFPIALVLAFCLSFTLDYVVGLSSFYTASLWGISMTKEIIVTLLSGALVPLQFFPEAVQQVLRFLPFQAIYNIPVMLITQPNLGVGDYLQMLAVQMVWLVVLWGLSRLFFNKAIRVLTVAGG